MTAGSGILPATGTRPSPAQAGGRPARPRPRVERGRGVLVVAATAVATVTAWEVLARAGALGSTVPPLSDALDHIVANRSTYRLHARATLTSAGLGLAAGVAVGVGAALLFSLSALAERTLRGLLLAAYCAPPVVLLPVLAATFSTDTTRLVVVALMVAYPMAVSVLVGLRGVDRRSVDLVRVSGGGALQVLWRLRLPHALPGALSGLRIAVPACLLGAMLAELAGGRWGLGLYLISGLKNGDRPLVWGVTVLVTAVSAAGYVACGALGGWVRSRRDQAEATESGILAAAREGSAGAPRQAGPLPRLAGGLLGVAVPVLAWWALVEVFGRSPIVARGPAGVWEHLVTAPRAAESRAALAEALRSTLGHTVLGVVAGLAAALVLALVLEARPGLKGALLPGALVSQTVPLVALVPILLVTFGRGTTTMILIGISITFFPGFVMIAQGLSEVPPSLVDLTRAAGGGPAAALRRVKLPHAVPHLTAAARLLAPRALLGVVLAEYVATGTGLGFLVYRARGTLDYGMMWSAAVVAVAISCAVYWAAGGLERLVLRRFAGAR